MPSKPLRGLHETLRTLQKETAVEVHERVDLSSWSSLRLGGMADLLIRCNSEDAVATVLAITRRMGVSYFVLGAGTNVVFPDAGLRLPVLTLGGALASWEIDLDGVVAGASANLTQVCRAVARAGLSGMEGLFGIPGSIGGAVVMNAGAYGVEVFDILEWVEVVPPGGRPVVIPASAIEHGYRTSELRQREDVVTRARFSLAPGELSAILARVREVNLQRRAKLPSKPSAGSIFRNPPGEHAGRLLDEAGCKGMRVGGAHVSRTHANVITVDRGATAADVMELARIMRGRVKDRFGVVLEPEVLFLDEMGGRVHLDDARA
ncbi:MAG: UDP-N-acetylmuramate dehydrogenase [Acidobacteria bacterium]|nr:UDP-N-acetylmuramate dehydrogenase [Acidobacteriota bacterium]